MIADPYKILEISPSASNDEIKKAYREMSRKYHPDSYVDNPLSNLAEEKFKEVQEAYEQIMKDRENGYGSGSYAQSSYSGEGSDESTEMAMVYSYLNARRYRDALSVLAGISNHTARWYYYSGVANAGMGNNVVALDYAREAARLEPGNPEYSNFLNQLNWQSQRYQNTRYNTTGSFGTGNLCCDLWCADSLCECMGGDLCSCM